MRNSTAWILPSVPRTPPEATKSPALMSREAAFFDAVHLGIGRQYDRLLAAVLAGDGQAVAVELLDRADDPTAPPLPWAHAGCANSTGSRAAASRASWRIAAARRRGLVRAEAFEPALRFGTQIVKLSTLPVLPCHGCDGSRSN